MRSKQLKSIDKSLFIKYYIDDCIPLYKCALLLRCAKKSLKQLALENNIPIRTVKSETQNNCLINKKFGKLLVLEEQGRTLKGHVKCKCVCECGNIHWTTRSALKRKERNTNQCKSCARKYLTKRIYKGVGDLSLSYWSKIEQNARRRGRKLDISIDYAWCLFLEQQAKCALTGISISLKEKERTASLDRKNSNLDYTYDNVQWVLFHINRMKQDLKEQVFIDLCKAVTKHHEDINAT